MITNIHTNGMGTASFDGAFGKMRKSQSFDVYPLKSGDEEHNILVIQSEHRYARIHIGSGQMLLSANHASYANSCKLQLDLQKGTAEILAITSEDLEPLLAHIRGTASPMAGNNAMRVFCDNSNACLV